MENTRNVFISHYNKDDEHITKLKDLLDKRDYIIKNSSIESSKPNREIKDDTIKRLLRMRIHWAGTFICLIGPQTHTRRWVNYEIEQANKKGKRIIGIYIQGDMGSDLPSNLNLYGDSVVGWDSQHIIDAIEGRRNDWVAPTGEPREPVFDPQRSVC